MTNRNPPVNGVSNSHADKDDDRFFDDPHLPAYFRNEQDNYFGLGLVVNWPDALSSASYNKSNYQSFVSEVETECFGGNHEFLFFKPFRALHITIATLFPAHASFELNPDCRNQTITNGVCYTESNTAESKDKRLSRSEVAAIWKRILQRASQNPNWPKGPLQLELQSAEIRNRAGIFLWKERTGGIESMRRCLEAAANEEAESGILQHLRIPNIIHTTFLRYHKVTETQACKTKLLRPSEANSILAERLLPTQSLFSNSANGGTADSQSVLAPFANLVNCKIYLLGTKRDHEIFHSLPLQGDGCCKTP